jgi:hypothetical protein
MNAKFEQNRIVLADTECCACGEPLNEVTRWKCKLQYPPLPIVSFAICRRHSRDPEQATEAGAQEFNQRLFKILMSHVVEVLFPDEAAALEPGMPL